MKQLIFTFLLFLCGLACSFNATAQERAPLDVAQSHIKANLEKWQLSATDVSDLVVSDNYQSAHNGVNHLYFIQRHAGIEVHTAIMGVHVKGDKVAYAVHRFVPELASKINTTQPLITSRQAIDFAAKHVGAYMPVALRQIGHPQEHLYVYEGGAIAKSDITVKLVFQQMRKSGAVRLAWHVTLDQMDTSDWWSIRVDAETGEILEKNNWTTYCNFRHDAGHQHGADCVGHAVESAQNTYDNLLLNDGAQYRVFPLPVESPIHGQQQLVINPADPTASPFGWHDINGATGADFTTTRGNNAIAYLDTLDTDTPGIGPSGGSALVFDFPHNAALEPAQMRPAAVVNLFYMANMMHDINYRYGFDEKAGNFQQNNYGNGGENADPVLAEAQDGSSTNNANFATPPDGSSGRMQMFLWTEGRAELLTILEPTNIAGGYETTTAGFGPEITETPIIGQVVIARDGSGQPDLCCEPIVNAAEVNGKIALIQRGECFFKEKVRNAQLAGAIAVIICNIDEGLIGMGDVGSVPNVNIPSVMLKSSSCQLIRTAIAGGATVQVRLQRPATTGPVNVDGSFDNGIVAHEYGHGISNRLTGGPSQADCLFNGEQMGEGWSDFFSLVTTAKPGDNGGQARGIGNYAVRASANASGIRRLPYSNDLNVNNQTYDDVIATTAPHPLGEVWVGMLWDLYWRLVDVYGWDEDVINGNGGNNIAIQLVTDGMKFQNCLPGFIDGRDAIIAADVVNFDGAHECLIWEVFARRGLGWSAQQGDNFDRNDGFQAFDVKPECIAELKIAKAMTPNIQAGENITVTLTATNHKAETATNVTVTDVIPAGASFLAGSVTGAANFSIDGDMISFQLGDMISGDEKVLTYRLASSPNLKSVRQFYDDMEQGDSYWGREALEGTDIWEITDSEATSGDFSWFVPSSNNENDQTLQLLDPVVVSAAKPIMRFKHRYFTESGIDGGIVQISTNGGATWERPEAYIFKNSYRGRIYYTAFAIPNVQAFWGSSNGFVDTYYDLSSYSGQEILIRFRFSTDAQAADDPEQGIGWYMDDFELLDMFNYNSEACISSNQGDQACAEAPDKGSIVEPGVSTAVEEQLIAGSKMEVFPNPTYDFVNVSFKLDQSSRVSLRLTGADGRLLRQSSMELGAGTQLLPFSLQGLPQGVYVLHVQTDAGSATEKIVKK